MIAWKLRPDDPDPAAAPAAREALRKRAKALAKGESFSTGTKASILTSTIRERLVQAMQSSPVAWLVTGRAHVAIAMSSHSFGIVERAALDRIPAAGTEIRVAVDTFVDLITRL